MSRLPIQLLALFFGFGTMAPAIAWTESRMPQSATESSNSSKFSLSPDETKILSQKSKYDIVEYTGPDGRRYSAILGGITRDQYGIPTFKFENPIPLLPADSKSVGTLPIDPGQNTSPGESPRGASSAADSGKRSGGSGGNAAVEAGTRAAVIYIVGALSEPNPEVVKELKASEIELEKSFDARQTEISNGNSFGTKAIQGATKALDRDFSLKDLKLTPIPYSNSPDFGKIPNASMANEAKDLWSKLDSTQCRNQNEDILKELGLESVATAVELSTEGDLLSAQAAILLAQEITRFLAGFNPVTSLIQDSYAVFSGKDFYSGKSLSPFEVATAGTSIAFTFATNGVGTPIANTIVAGLRISENYGFKGAIQAFKTVSSEVSKMAALGTKSIIHKAKLPFFSKSVLGGKVKDITAVVHFNDSWSATMKSNFPKISNEIDKYMDQGIYNSLIEKGIPNNTIQDRYELAKASFYSIGGSTRSPEDIASHLNLIDYRHDVHLELIHQGERLYQYGLPSVNVPGDYAASSIVSTSRVGIGKIGTNSRTLESEAYVLKKVIVTNDTIALRSTAAPGIDNRSIGFQEFEGGTWQVFVGREHLKLIP